MPRRNRALPLVYSCSGCSGVAQLANALAVRLDREGEAEMSCIAGVGGDVPGLVRVARSGRPVLALDGCPLACVRNTLRRHGVTPSRHVGLQDYGIKKRYGEEAPEGALQRLYPELRQLARSLRSDVPA